MTVSGTNDCATGTASPNLAINVSSSVPLVYYIYNFTTGSGQNTCIGAQQSIFVAGPGYNFTVTAGGSVILVCGQKILLYPGVVVQSGGNFHGYISTNGVYCTTYPNKLVSNPIVVDEVANGFSEQPSALPMRIYPNPTSGSCTIEMTGESRNIPLHVEVFFMNGTLVQSFDMFGGQGQTLSLGEQPRGIYLIRVSSGNFSEVRKIVRL
jgi:hypothetical protein